MWEKTNAKIASQQQQQEANTQKESQFEHYSKTHGLTRQQFDTMWQARAQGNHFDADTLFGSYAKVNTAKQKQQEQQQADRNKLVTGNSQSQPSQVNQQTDVQAHITRLRGLKGLELENAIVSLYGELPESQVNVIVNASLIPENT